MIKQFQELYFEKRYSATDEKSGYYSCDFKKLAEAYGLKSYKIDKNSKNIDKILQSIFEIVNEPILLEVDIDYDTYIYPKLEFNKTIDKISPELTIVEQNEIDFIFNDIN